MTEEILGPLIEKVDPALVSPVVAYLASEECAVSGEIYSVGAGRVSRIFIAEAPGYFKKDLTIEDVRDNWDTIRAEGDYLIPTSVNDEFGHGTHLAGLVAEIRRALGDAAGDAAGNAGTAAGRAAGDERAAPQAARAARGRPRA